jgi:hypothetical protein
MLIIALTVMGLHVFAMNVLYPKVLGKRLQLDPLAVTISLLIWGWIWGALGLILAVPIMGAVKIVCDHVATLRPIGAWMGNRHSALSQNRGTWRFTGLFMKLLFMPAGNEQSVFQNSAHPNRSVFFG